MDFLPDGQKDVAKGYFTEETISSFKKTQKMSKFI